MTTNFQDILNTRADSVEPPKSFTPGKVAATVKEFKTGKSDKKGTPYVEFHYTIDSIIDVAPEFSEQMQTAINSKNTMKETYYVTEKSLYRLIEHLENMGIQKAGKTTGQMLTECQGQSLALVLDYETSAKDGKQYINVKSSSKL